MEPIRKILLSLVFLLLAGAIASQNLVSTIDGVYIERDTTFSAISQDTVRDGDVIVFDIPGVNDYLLANDRLLRDIVLKVDDVELPELNPYMLGSESGLVLFKFAFRHVTPEHRQKLYHLTGGATKEVLFGIKIDESKSLTYGQRGSIYFSSIRNWSTFGIILIAGFFLFFIVLIYRYKSLIQSEVSNFGVGDQFEPKYSFGKSQLAYWTFIVVACFIYIWGFTGDLQSINTTATILLGISASTTMIGKAIGKKEESEAVGARKYKLVSNRYSEGNYIRDILSNADGISIHRLQVLVFNIVFGFAFFKSVIFDYTMPEFSAEQLTLLGISNGTYSYLKTGENQFTETDTSTSHSNSSTKK